MLIRPFASCVMLIATLARTELVPFFRAWVLARAVVPVVFGAFVLEGWAPATLLLFGAVDLAGAVWTWTALKS